MTDDGASFSKTFRVGWGDMDFNAHMRNTSFLDRSADTRLMFFEERGFSMREFERLGFGPVIQREELEYFRELRLLEAFRVTVELAGLATDGSRFRLRNRFFRSDERLCARVTSEGGWLDVRNRRLIVPPDGIVGALRLLRTNDFEELSARAD